MEGVGGQRGQVGKAHGCVRRREVGVWFREGGEEAKGALCLSLSLSLSHSEENEREGGEWRGGEYI